MKRLAFLAVVACLCGCALPGTGRADFIGQSVHVYTAVDDTSIVGFNLGTQTIVAGGNTFAPKAAFVVNVFATSINIPTHIDWAPETFNGYVIAEVGPSPSMITGVSLDSTNVSGFDSSRLTFDATDVFMNFQGINTKSDSFVTADVTFAPTAAPEPASLTLMGLGAAGLLGYGWRRRKRPA
jgi:hypothetical protein